MTDIGPEWELRIAERLIIAAKRSYEESGNPLNVWRAYVECRAAGLEIPEWVLEYLDRVGRNFWQLSMINEKKPPPDEMAPAIAVALEMKKPGKSGSGNVFKQFQDSSGLLMACEVAWHRQDNHKLDIAYELVAKKHGKSKSTVRTAWLRYGSIFLEK